MEFVSDQFGSFLQLLLIGMVFGVFFDLYRVFRGMVKVNKTVDFLGDLLFWVLMMVFLIPLIFWSTWLELRLYVWFSLLVGVLSYFWLFSPIFIPVFLRFRKILVWLPRQATNGTWRIWLLLRKAGWILTAGWRMRRSKHKFGTRSQEPGDKKSRI